MLSVAVTMNTFGLLLDQWWIGHLADFADIKHHNTEEVYLIDACFVGCSPWTGKFHSDYV